LAEGYHARIVCQRYQPTVAYRFVEYREISDADLAFDSIQQDPTDAVFSRSEADTVMSATGP